MQPLRQRPSTKVPSTYAASIPTTQIQALDRRHLLDQQQAHSRAITARPVTRSLAAGPRPDATETA